MKLTNPATTMAFILFASMNHHDYGAAGASIPETGSTSSVYYEDSNSTTAATVVESDTPNGNAAKELEEDTIASTTEINASSSKQSYLRSSFNVPTLTTKNVIKSDEESHEDHTLVHEQVELSRSRLLDIDNPLKPTDWQALPPSDYPADSIERITKYAPIFDFDGNSCLPAAAVSSTGVQNGGLKTTGSMTGQCRSHDFMKRSNTYHRWKRYDSCGQGGTTSYEFHMYELYFEKDQTNFGGIPGAQGHRHDLEHVLIMFRNNQPYKVGVSAHGKYITRSWSDSPKSGTHVKVVYHSDKGGFSTHAFRFAKEGETRAENPEHKWVTPPLVSWDYMKGDGVSNQVLREKLNSLNFGSAKFAINDKNFSRYLRDLFPNINNECSTGFRLTKSFSEERGGYSEMMYGPIRSVYCKGRFCDNKSLFGINLPGKLDPYSYYWTSSFSEEGNNSRTCLRDMFVTQMKCSGRYCDNLQLRCSKFATNSGYQIDHNKKKEIAWFSEEHGKGSCGTGHAVIGIRCSGRYCDNLRLICAAWGQK